MSTERIDHVGEANAILQAADVYVSVEHVQQTGEKKSDQLANALVHATLALVEEQRTANRIAYASLLEAQYAEAEKHPDGFQWDTHASSLERHTAVLAQIREGLGL